MFGYACTETPDLMPAPPYYAHSSCAGSAKCAAPATLGEGPAARRQVQVTPRYNDGKPVGATSVVVSTQHEEGMEQAEIKRCSPDHREQLPEGWMCPGNEPVNPTGVHRRATAIAA